MKGRRELLKVLGVAGAAGAVWKKPVVDAVVLPIHASTSLRCATSSDFNNFNIATLPCIIDIKEYTVH